MKELIGSERGMAVADLPTNLFHLNEKVKYFTDGRAEELQKVPITAPLAISN